MLLGFGLTELQNENEFAKNLADKIINNIQYDKNRGIDDNILENIKYIVSDAQESHNIIYNSYDSGDSKPERYFNVFISPPCTNYSTVFIPIKFFHINSRHPFSPDGMAAINVNTILTIDWDYINDKLKYNFYGVHE